MQELFSSSHTQSTLTLHFRLSFSYAYALTVFIYTFLKVILTIPVQCVLRSSTNFHMQEVNLEWCSLNIGNKASFSSEGCYDKALLRENIFDWTHIPNCTLHSKEMTWHFKCPNKNFHVTHCVNRGFLFTSKFYKSANNRAHIRWLYWALQYKL